MANLFNVEFRLSRLIMNPFLEDTCIIMENSGYKNHSLNIFSENSSLLHGNVLFSSKNMAVYKTLVLLLESPIFFVKKYRLVYVCMLLVFSPRLNGSLLVSALKMDLCF